jgi:hypothetical protein
MKQFSEHSKYGEHSNYGFYSFNEKIGLRNPKMTDFFPIILKKLSIEFYDDKRDREKVLEHLKKLGYF